MHKLIGSSFGDHACDRAARRRLVSDLQQLCTLHRAVDKGFAIARILLRVAIGDPPSQCFAEGIVTSSVRSEPSAVQIPQNAINKSNAFVGLGREGIVFDIPPERRPLKIGLASTRREIRSRYRAITSRNFSSECCMTAVTTRASFLAGTKGLRPVPRPLQDLRVNRPDNVTPPVCINSITCRADRPLDPTPIDTDTTSLFPAAFLTLLNSSTSPRSLTKPFKRPPRRATAV